MEKELTENHKRYMERVALYRKFGYDIEQERSFIIEKALPFSGNILEAGTGKGYFTLALARAGLNFFSFDISAAEQRYALMNLRYYGLHQQVTFCVADVESIPCDEDFFNVIFAVNMIHHLSSVSAACNELIRILAPSGKIVVSDFSTAGFAVIDKIHEHEGRKHELNSGTMTEARKIFAERGFDIKEYKSLMQEVIVTGRGTI